MNDQEGGAAQAPAPETAQGAAHDTPEALRAALEAAELKLREQQDLYLRAVAETENARRRAQEEVAKAHKFAIESFAEALVPVFDSLEKAAGDTGANVQVLREGVELTLRQLTAAFERGRLQPINPLGERFDPHRHQAISMVPGDGSLAANHVAAVLQKGWMITDRVLRPALVTVVQAGAA
jgi:molecular chaperone GrpE